MNKQIRQTDILNYIYEHQMVSVNELVNKFKVTPMTIRRDLNELSAKRLVRRVHGGATISNVLYAEESYEERSISYIDEKRRIAEAAYQIIEENDCLILDGGTTTRELAKLMRCLKNVTVIINDFIIYNILKDNKNINLIFAGGNIINDFNTITSGMINFKFYENFNVDLAFIGVMSVDLTSGIFQSDLDVATSKLGMIRAANESYILVDHTKFNKNAMFKVVSMDEINNIITDTNFNISQYEIPEHINVLRV
ncbi:DeoR/GlpR transcriptional regulator [Facklamia sp. DSM 111018]|uniref:DeoR/GlpR transcriptional regulator n=1 Tax=Facklamia lactis TaxID=2749967 RepID=A0ABS0LPU3_9LACT|nr:DeoR/GlpR family DNA-binding transcription regulator [Facklamia lactis]MBG9986180.1 DeoR/GlpR transcriptional regulator [Facklamia lactis]